MDLSVLDLCPIVEGGDAARAFRESVALAQEAERLGFKRFWLAEHHNMPGVASAATALAIQHVAAHTTTIRVGAGGIMLPNHAPLVVAEQFGTLATLFPGRIDLGLGRAPGTDMATARALRRHMVSEDSFPQDVVELIGYLSKEGGEAAVKAVPGVGTEVPVWILGSSLYGAQLAAYLGLPYAFASHFAPGHLEEALEAYRATFRPSRWLEAPRVMVAMGAVAAATDEEAERLRSSQVLSFARLRTGQAGKLPPPGPLDSVPREAMAGVNHALGFAAVGSPATVRRRLGQVVEQYRPDEIILAGMIFDLEARLASLRIMAEAAQELKAAA
ncbi:bacterial luciferase family protein [Rubellimicrobium mesophilum DSM 19309]|uniref:Luciferase-like monooxygenase n=1 Tax=Rubellimicrobium mesophilum DSM 19309 TaxID=442562 RepID=A0A017HWE9_9RHOB|nr:LLM class flavin-dependent oxidoreductase [Rubellimicrobium mesophilum]EYD78044.1 bacterial luciferase family protein [Rubellimicrobium mesophilum DSM 19309]